MSVFVAPLLLHAEFISSKWTLKQVQGDVGFHNKPPSFSHIRHPELGSGSIEQLTLTHRGQAKTNRQINPMRVCGIDQVDFPGAMPVLQLLFSRYGRVHTDKNLEMHQPVNRISGRMAGGQTAAMLRQALEQIRRNADVQRAVVFARKYINAWCFFLFNSKSLAETWTLKQVQGDVNFYVTSPKPGTLNLFQGPSGNPELTARGAHD